MKYIDHINFDLSKPYYYIYAANDREFRANTLADVMSLWYETRIGINKTCFYPINIGKVG